MNRGAGLATLAYLSVALIGLGACRKDETMQPIVRNPDGGPPAGFNCPGEGLTICDLKYEMSPEHPALSDPVALTGLLVTSPVLVVSKTPAPENMVTLSGFYAQDQESVGGEFSGILVVFSPDLNAMAPTVGDIVDVNGTYEQFGREGVDQQKQIKAASITATGRGTVEPLAVDNPTTVIDKAINYEGVLLKLPEVAITNADVMHNGSPIFGAFELENTLVVSDVMYEYTNPQVGEVFSSITGILRVGTAPFDAGLYMLSPRSALDVVPKNASAVVTSIPAIQDITHPGHPPEGCFNMGETVGKCAVAQLTNVVVTAVGSYVSTNLRALWVQDDTVADGRFAGIKVVYNPNSANLIPEVGMRVDIEGEILEYYRGTQIQYATITVNNPTRTEVQPKVLTPSDLDRTSDPEMSPWEGLLVRLENTTVTTGCLEDPRQHRDRGNFILDEKVFVGSGFDYAYNGDLRPQGTMCDDGEGNPTGLCTCMSPPPNDQRNEGDLFLSVTGVMDFAFDDFQLQPRQDADLVK